MDIDTKSYVWRGCSLIDVHQVGPYHIVEYWHSAADNAPDKRRRKEFGIYIDGKSRGHAYSSLDEALAGCIAIRKEGPNTRADTYFIRSIGAQGECEIEGAQQ